jgi:hypothetical protein
MRQWPRPQLLTPHDWLGLIDPFLVGFSDAMDRVFLIAAVVVIPAFLLSFFLKEVKLRTESGLQAQAAERARAAEAVEVETISDDASAESLVIP